MNCSLLLAGKSILLQEALQITLNQKGYKVTKEYGNLSKVKENIQKYKPDIIIWDDTIISDCFRQILWTIKPLKKKTKSVLILDSTMLHFMAEGMLCGIKGFVHRKSSIRELNRCLTSVQKGLVFISPLLTGSDLTDSDTHQPEVENAGLTQREVTILRLISRRNSNKEIAKILSISYRTVQNHRQNICNKLGLSGRNKLYEYAVLHFNIANDPDDPDDPDDPNE